MKVLKFFDDENKLIAFGYDGKEVLKDEDSNKLIEDCYEFLKDEKNDSAWEIEISFVACTYGYELKQLLEWFRNIELLNIKKFEIEKRGE